MKKLLLTLFSLAAIHQAQAAAGDLAVISLVGSFNPDRIRVLVLAPIPANSVFTFTDNNWNASTSTLAASEGALVGTSPNTVLPRGTVVSFDASSTFSAGGAASHGTYTVFNGGLFNFTSVDDNMFIYSGTTAPTSGNSPLWVWGINGRAWSTTGAAGTAGINDQPSALVGYSVAMPNPVNGRNADFYYTGNTTNTATNSNIAISGTKSSILTNITNGALYFRNDVAATPTAQPAYPTYNATVLPLSLLSFSAEARNGHVQASWTTANEEQVSAMELQRSADGRAFETVATLNATNEAGRHTYTAADNAPLAGRSYYRLATRNYDGSVQYSETVSMLAVTKEQAITLQATPNPVQRSFSLLHSAAGANARLTIHGVDGRLIAVRQPVPGATATDFSDIDLAAGSYVATFENDGQKITTLLAK